jgi:mannose-6-phosphate isomerase-like protein (cupin superfamily)
MEIIHGTDLDRALESIYRVYLCGDLKKPQDLKWIHDENIEMGISSYQKFTADQPHYHLHATEYNFILEGKSRFLLVDENKEVELEKHSLFVLPPMTKYASKHTAGTKILFFKAPGGNDKTLFAIDNALKKWLSSWEAAI